MLTLEQCQALKKAGFPQGSKETGSMYYVGDTGEFYQGYIFTEDVPDICVRIPSLDELIEWAWEEITQKWKEEEGRLSADIHFHLMIKDQYNKVSIYWLDIFCIEATSKTSKILAVYNLLVKAGIVEEPTDGS